ncbi:hypothetical protein ATCC90586_008955 [Pythium insidiosum]|nr:hypothetical protein ATCC90586_008955 [Pythium insidiosum]
MRPSVRERQQQLEQRLEQATDVQLQRLAQFSRPQWCTLVLHVHSADSEELPSDADNAAEKQPQSVHRLEVLEGSSLEDVRKLIVTFIPEIPAWFEFAHVTGSADERSTRVEDVVQTHSVVAIRLPR